MKLKAETIYFYLLLLLSFLKLDIKNKVYTREAKPYYIQLAVYCATIIVLSKSADLIVKLWLGFKLVFAYTLLILYYYGFTRYLIYK